MQEEDKELNGGLPPYGMPKLGYVNKSWKHSGYHGINKS